MPVRSSTPVPRSGAEGMGQPAIDPGQYQHRREDRIRVTDIDFQLHVNNAVFAQFFASGRYDFLREVVRPHLPEGYRLLVAGTQISFLAEMVYGPPIETLTRVAKLGRSSMLLDQLILQAGRAVSRAETTMVFHLAGQSTPWPDAVRAMLGGEVDG